MKIKTPNCGSHRMEGTKYSIEYDGQCHGFILSVEYPYDEITKLFVTEEFIKEAFGFDFYRKQVTNE
jgi:hypothetical protein